jgi:phage terminase large subunit-like protein
LIKRDWWQDWEHDEMPPLEYVIQSYDTAFTKKQTADYSAITTWGVFTPNPDSGPNLILLDAVKDRYEFPDLRREALEQKKYWDPDLIIIEAKASGQPLIDELRNMGIPVADFSSFPDRKKKDRFFSRSRSG